MILKFILVLIFLYFLVNFSSCATGQQTDRPYQEIGRSAHFELESDGLIIGFEKRKISGKDKNVLGDLRDMPLYSNLVEPLKGDNKLVKKRNKLFRRYTLFNSKVMIPTQILSKVNGNQRHEYNAYEDSIEGNYDYTLAYKKLDATFEQLKSEGLGDKYTHIIVMNMGWNNDQVESMWRYNTIIEKLFDRARDDGIQFRPFVIAITWPSVWRSISDFVGLKKVFHLISYPNKTLDADELGITWMNWIINEKLARLIGNEENKTAKLILIGHSLGARILTRALFSTGHLLESKKSDTVDLLIGLQPAFSARRFVDSSGLEGFPYSEFRQKKTHLVFTTSVHDRANPIANYITGAKHLGGGKGLSYAEKIEKKLISEGDPSVFQIEKWDNASKESPKFNSTVLVIDASNIVVGSENPKLSAHNDILDDDMSKLLWHYIKGLE